MSKYGIIIYWSKDDQAFIAEVPELPGCAADGATYQEALANVAVTTREFCFYNRYGQFIYSEPAGRFAGYEYPMFSIHRGEAQLLTMLGERLDEREHVGVLREHVDAEAMLLGCLRGLRPDARHHRGLVRLARDADHVAHGRGGGEGDGVEHACLDVVADLRGRWGSTHGAVTAMPT